MNPIRRSLMAAGLAVLGLSGCLGTESVVGPPMPGDSTLVLGLREELLPDTRRQFLDARTSTEFACFNYRIDHRADIDGRTISIQFTGVSIGEICLAALGPARATIPLGTLAEGRYDLVLSVRGETHVSELTVTPEAFTVRPARGRWTEFEAPVLRRVPPGTIWGLVGYDVATKTPLVESYLDALRAAGARSEPFTPGDYGHFRVDAGGTIETLASTGYWFSRAFLFRFDGDPSVFPDIIRGYADSLSISLYNDRGESWISWALPNPMAARPAVRPPRGG